MKYHNRKTRYNGEKFDSKKEANRYAELLLLERAGKIEDLRRQVKFELIPVQRVNGKIAERAAAYIADFVYVDNETGKTVVEDTKGVRTRDYILKRKLMLYKYGIGIREV